MSRVVNQAGWLSYHRRWYIQAGLAAAVLAIVLTGLQLKFYQHQAQQDLQAANLQLQLDQQAMSPTLLPLDQQGRVLAASLDRQQQYDYLQRKVERWDHPCFQQATQELKAYQREPGAFDRFVAKLWSCTQ